MTGDHPNTPTAAILRAAGLDAPPAPDQRRSRARRGPGGVPARSSRRPRSRGTGRTRVTVARDRADPGGDHGRPDHRRGPPWTATGGPWRSPRPPGRCPCSSSTARRGTRSPRPRSGGTVAPAADPGLVVARTLPAGLRRTGGVGHGGAPTGRSPSPSTRASPSSWARVSDLPAKYEDVAAIIAHASLRGAHTIDVTVPRVTHRRALTTRGHGAVPVRAERDVTGVRRGVPGACKQPG